MILGVSGLAGLAYGVTQFDDLTPYPGTAALIPVFAAAAILASSTAGRLVRSWGAGSTGRRSDGSARSRTRGICGTGR